MELLALNRVIYTGSGGGQRKIFAAAYGGLRFEALVRVIEQLNDGREIIDGGKENTRLALKHQAQ